MAALECREAVIGLPRKAVSLKTRLLMKQALRRSWKVPRGASAFRAMLLLNNLTLALLLVRIYGYFLASFLTSLLDFFLLRLGF